MPLGQCETGSVPRSVIGRAARPSGTTPARTAATGTPRSTTVPQAWHSAQRPTHFTLVQPHSVQANDDVGRAMGSAYVRHPTAGSCRACATTPAVTAAGRGLRGRRATRTCTTPDEAAEPGVPLADAGGGHVAARIGLTDDGD